MISVISPVILLPNPPPVYSLMNTTLLGIDAQPARDRGDGLGGALRAGVNVDLAVLPVRHRRAGLEALVAGVRRDERFVEDQRRVLEARVDIADRPFIGRLAHRQTALLGLGEVRLGPLELRDVGRHHSGRAARRIRRRLAPRTQTLPSVLAFGPPGRRLTSGSTTNGSGSKSSRIFSIASAAVSSSTAATARIGSPWYNGSLVSAALSLLVCQDHGAVIVDAVGRSGADRPR